MKKHRVTGCARLFLALIIIAPLAYLGASYYNGQNGIQNIKNLLGIGEHKSATIGDGQVDNSTKDLNDDISDKDREIQKLKDENSDLRKEIESLKAQVEQLKKQPPQ